jgi:uncharacterized protein (TIGR01440 family)
MNSSNPSLADIKKDWEDILDEFWPLSNLKPGQILVLGCSTSEVLGKRIGTQGSLEIAAVIIEALLRRVRSYDVFLAVQGCEHLNRALVVESACVEKYGLEEVMVMPAPHAGGAMAVKAWHSFAAPQMVERLQGHAGIDIGDTFIGMHLRPVVVPVRLSVQNLGKAHITLARTRPRLIGGARAVYPNIDEKN